MVTAAQVNTEKRKRSPLQKKFSNFVSNRSTQLKNGGTAPGKARDTAIAEWNKKSDAQKNALSISGKPKSNAGKKKNPPKTAATTKKTTPKKTTPKKTAVKNPPATTSTKKNPPKKWRKAYDYWSASKGKMIHVPRHQIKPHTGKRNPATVYQKKKGGFFPDFAAIKRRGVMGTMKYRFNEGVKLVKAHPIAWGGGMLVGGASSGIIGGAFRLLGGRNPIISEFAGLIGNVLGFEIPARLVRLMPFKASASMSAGIRVGGIIVTVISTILGIVRIIVTGKKKGMKGLALNQKLGFADVKEPTIAELPKIVLSTIGTGIFGRDNPVSDVVVKRYRFDEPREYDDLEDAEEDAGDDLDDMEDEDEDSLFLDGFEGGASTRLTAADLKDEGFVGALTPPPDPRRGRPEGWVSDADATWEMGDNIFTENIRKIQKRLGMSDADVNDLYKNVVVKRSKTEGENRLAGDFV